jgi:hypothetical protein
MNNIDEKIKGESDTFIEIDNKQSYFHTQRLKIIPLWYVDGNPTIVIGPHCKI